MVSLSRQEKCQSPGLPTVTPTITATKYTIVGIRASTRTIFVGITVLYIGIKNNSEGKYNKKYLSLSLYVARAILWGFFANI